MSLSCYVLEKLEKNMSAIFPIGLSQISFSTIGDIAKMLYSEGDMKYPQSVVCRKISITNTDLSHSMVHRRALKNHIAGSNHTALSPGCGLKRSIILTCPWACSQKGW